MEVRGEIFSLGIKLEYEFWQKPDESDFYIFGPLFKDRSLKTNEFETRKMVRES
jgi:hypothetical protein